ncbi:MAG: alpha-L-rhamnosidase N-terminal domain-containing protein [Janthinobacterium lividum]
MKLGAFWLLLLVIAGLAGNAQPTQRPAAHPSPAKPWPAFWIATAGEPAHDYGVYRFRKELNLAAKPASFIVHVSGDTRYQLLVNGRVASRGPARSDLRHWNYETVDLAPYLHPGPNAVAALVWNEGEARPEAQLSNRTAFILQGNGPAEAVLTTGSDWKSSRDTSYQPLLATQVLGYYVAGAGECVDRTRQQSGWSLAGFDDRAWPQATIIEPGQLKGAAGSSAGWLLVPSPLPQLELTPQRLPSLRLATGLATVPKSFPATKAAVTIPAHTTATLLLDQTFLTNAYPTLVFSGGQGAGLSLGYAEGLYRSGKEKGNRNELAGKHFAGRRDSIRSDGSAGQVYTPLTWRTYRYVQLRITTEAAPLVLEDIYGVFTAYPFQQQARLATDNPEVQQIASIGWRTARLCAAETYMDCPYYEQLQYLGDTRIQALVSYFNTTDDRLARNAITQLNNSRTAEGITLSRYPTRHPQQIPPFSLFWIGMLHDYYRYRPDSAFVQDKLPGERAVLAFFARYQQPDGSLKDLPYWGFTDWTVNATGWRSGAPPLGADGSSALLDLQLLLAYQTAQQLESRLGLPAIAAQYQQRAEQLRQTVQRNYWDERRQLYADTPEKTSFSQHANALAILTGTVPAAEASALARRMLADGTLTQASLYFKFYVHQALTQAGLGNEYLSWLGAWRENIRLGLTTWGETPQVSSMRSDCHAWGASPNIEFFRTVLGIDSDAPGFARVKIEPHLGLLKEASGEMPHPRGRVQVKYHYKRRNHWQIAITLPSATTGYLLWAGQRYPLKAGPNTIRI